MKKIALVCVVLLVLFSFTPVKALGEPPAGLAGTITIVAKGVNSVTLHAEQTGGTLVKLMLENTCYIGSYYDPDNVFVGTQTVTFVGSVTFTFNTGPRTVHGRVLVPTDCWADLGYYFSSNRAILLDFIFTKP